MDVDDRDNNKADAYAWEGDYKRSWDLLQEDERGSLRGAVASIQEQLRKRRLQRDTTPVQKGIIRHLYILLDMSSAMAELDMRPSRVECVLNYVDKFIGEYFEQNPLSQLGIILTRDGLAEKVSELSGNGQDHVNALRRKTNREPRGEPSIQNSLELAYESLSHIPAEHGSREVLMIMGSLTTCDPGNVFDTMRRIKDAVRVSVIGLSAELSLCRTISEKTKGTYHVVLNETHFREVLFEHLPPPPAYRLSKVSNLILMGFPQRHTAAFICICHGDTVARGYQCPRCSSLVCSIPMDCPTCSLTLISSHLLARSYHHLFPVVNFQSSSSSDSDKPTVCFGCEIPFLESDARSIGHQCPLCTRYFCFECDLYIHEHLHNCPGCS